MSVVRFIGPYDNRVAAELPEGFVVGICEGDCAIAPGANLTGVVRRVGQQQWTDGRHVMTVEVEDFDLDGEGLRNWSTGVE